MSTATMTELMTKTGALIQRVLGGEEITVTSHGRPVAVLTPVGGDRREKTTSATVGAPRSAGLDAGRDGAPAESVAGVPIESGARPQLS